jgi:membrane protease YdiL (CAAX protease family)
MPELHQLSLNLVAWLLLAVAGGAAVAGVWFLVPGARRPLLPPQRLRAVPWQGAEIWAALLLFLAGPMFLDWLLERTGFFTWLYGPDFPAAAGLRQLWIMALWPLLQVPVLLAFFRLASGTRPYQLGLTRHRLRQDVAAGFLTWLVITPAMLLLYFLLTLRITPDEHPLVTVVRAQPTGLTWLLVVGATVVGAPVWEELLFRGVLQAWLARRPWGGDAAVAGALALALLLGWDKHGAWPALFVLALYPGYVFAEWAAWRWLPYPGAARTIYGTALLFGAAHSQVWPSPIPLFLLGLALGWLAYRTQSLIGPLVAHALVNGVACLTMVLAGES